MIKRIVLGLIGAVAGAVAISAATHAVDIENSTIEDGDTRFAIAGIGATIFVLCVVMIVRSLGSRRRARRLVAEATRSLPADVGADGRPEPSPTVVPARSLADRLPARATGDARPGTLSVPPAESMTPDRSGSGLTSPTGPMGSVPVFAERPAAPEPTEQRAQTADARRATLFGAPPESPPSGTAPPETTPPESTPPEAIPPEATPPEATPPESEGIVADGSGELPNDAVGGDAALVLRNYSPAQIDDTIDESGRQAVDHLVATGALTSEGPLTPEDIRTMLFIALSTQQLRSILHDARAEEPLFALGEAPATSGELPTWVDVDRGPDPGDDEPPSGHLYATGA